MIKYYNKFSLDYLRKILKTALDEGYQFKTLKDYYTSGTNPDKVFLLRHDLDAKPQHLMPMLELQVDLGIRSTTFIRINAGDYNPFDYKTFPILNYASNNGFELGLHTNFVEFSAIHGLDPEKTLKAELECLRSFFNIESLTPHRDINYAINALPWIESNWEKLKSKYNLIYHGYEPLFIQNTKYLNEGLNPHLCWRNGDPIDIIKTGQPIYMLLHPHWWYKNHPFEY